MLTLISKDFKLLFADFGGGKLFGYAVNAILIAIFVGLEAFIISGVLTRLKPYSGAPLAFLSFALFFISVLLIFVCLSRAKTLFFQPKDVLVLSAFPLSASQIIFSKLCFLFAAQYLTGLAFTYPVIASFAAVFHRTAKLYFLGVFYPALTFPFECGVALLLTYPYKLLGDYLKNRPAIQFAVAVALAFALCLVYGKVLGLFVNLVAADNLQSVLNANSISAMISARAYMLPIGTLAEVFFAGATGRGVAVYLSISLGFFILGTTACAVTYNFLRSRTFQLPGRRISRYKNSSPLRALISKEACLLFVQGANIASFTALLAVQPLLSYLIIYSLNTVFSSGIFAYYVALLPNFLPIINVLVSVLVSLIISRGANSYISAEGGNLRLIKTLPVSSGLQLGVKVLFPFCLSAISLVVTFAVLFFTKVTGLATTLFGLSIALIMQLSFCLISLYEELHSGATRPRSNLLSSIFCMALPPIYAVSTVVASYFGLNLYAAFIIGLALAAASLVPTLAMVGRRTSKLFKGLEVP